MTIEEEPTQTHSARLLGWLLLLLAFLELGAVVLCTIFLPDPWWVFFCITLPGLVLGIILLLNGWASSQSRITLSPERLQLCIPTWRAMQTPPMQRLDESWSAVCGVDFRNEYYWLPPFGLFPTSAYRIRTKDRVVVIGGRQFLWNQRLMRTILRRAGVELTVCEDVETTPWAGLGGEPASWTPA